MDFISNNRFLNKKENLLNKIRNNTEIQKELYDEMSKQHHKFKKIKNFIFRILGPLIVEIPIISLLISDLPLIRLIAPMTIILMVLITLCASKKESESIFNWFIFRKINQSYINDIAKNKVSLQAYEILTKHIDKSDMYLLLDEPLTYKELSINDYPDLKKEKDLKEKIEIDNENKEKLKKVFVENLYDKKKD